MVSVSNPIIGDNQTTPKLVTATCPAGMRAIAGGAAVVNNTSDKVGLTTSTISGTDAWHAEARQLVGGSIADWSVTVTVICAPS